MPCFTLTLKKANVVYRLSDLIDQQKNSDEGPYGGAWPQINIQASYDNQGKNGQPVMVKYGDVYLSGLRWGGQLMPGDWIPRALSGGKFVATGSLYFLCEDMDNAQISVELLGS